MDEEKKKEGVSVKELEGYAKKHRFEIFFCLLFILASLFTLVFWGPVFSIFFAGIGGIITVFMPDKIDQLQHKMAGKLFAKEGATQLIIGIVVLIVAIFLAPLIFFVIGAHARKSMIHLARDASGASRPPSRIGFLLLKTMIVFLNHPFCEYSRRMFSASTSLSKPYLYISLLI